MKALESMKQFIRENNFTALVNELVTGADMDVADAVEYLRHEDPKQGSVRKQVFRLMVDRG